MELAVQEITLNAGNAKDKAQAQAVKRKFLDIMKKEISVYKCCVKAGIDRTTVYNEWLINDPEFAATFDQIRETHLDKIEGNVWGVASNDKRAFNQQRFVLSNMRKRLYGNDGESNVVNNTLILGAMDDNLAKLASSILGKALPTDAEIVSHIATSIE